MGNATPTDLAGYHLPKPQATPAAQRLGAVRDSLRARSVQAHSKRSPAALLLVALVHIAALWWLALHVPSVRDFQARAYAFTFQFRAVTSLRLIDDSDQRAQGSEAPLALRPTAKLSLLSNDEPKPVEQRITATVPEIKPDLLARDTPVAPQAPDTQQTDAKARPAVTELVPTPKPVVAPVPVAKPIDAAVIVEGSAAQQRDEPAATSKTITQLAPTLVKPLTIDPAVPVLAATAVATTALQLKPLVIEINLPAALITPPVPVAPPPNALPTAATAPSPTPVPAPVQPPAANPAGVSVQVIVNVVVPPGGSLPAGALVANPGGQTAPGGAGGGSGTRATGTGGTGAVGSGGSPGAGGGPSTNAGPRTGGTPAANAPLDFRLPPLRGPYAPPPKQRSLADMANEQLRKGNPTTAIEDGVRAAEKPDCIGPPKSDSAVGGLLNLPKLALDAVRGKCN